MEVRNAHNHETIGFGNKVEFNGKEKNKYCGWINGPLVEGDGSATGTIVDNGKMIKGLQKDSSDLTDLVEWTDPSGYKDKNFNILDKNGIIGLKKDGKFFLIPYSERNDIKANEIIWAFQNGPILLQDGQNTFPVTSLNKNFRTGIGYTLDHKNIITIISTEECNFHDFASLFDRYNVKNAMYLDGFPQQSTYIGLRNTQSTGTIEVKEKRLLIQFFKQDCNDVTLKSVNDGPFTNGARQGTNSIRQ
jgi:uncharacterized protein YigE (DUF2233 family)